MKNHFMQTSEEYYNRDRLFERNEKVINEEPTKPIKDCWTREEVIKLLKEVMRISSYTSIFDFEQWIESNL